MDFEGAGGNGKKIKGREGVELVDGEAEGGDECFPAGGVVEALRASLD